MRTVVPGKFTALKHIERFEPSRRDVPCVAATESTLSSKARVVKASAYTTYLGYVCPQCLTELAVRKAGALLKRAQEPMSIRLRLEVSNDVQREHLFQRRACDVGEGANTTDSFGVGGVVDCPSPDAIKPLQAGVREFQAEFVPVADRIKDKHH